MSKPEYSKRKVDKAGMALSALRFFDIPKDECVHIINYWRIIHLEPLKYMLDILASETDKHGSFIIAGRIKKYSTILDKLRREDTVNDLSRMYDIAGCRIVVKTLEEMEALCDVLKQSPNYDEEKSYKKNYLITPHPSGSGYRCRHMIFSFENLESKHQKLFVEVQIRTEIEHNWATAVELHDKATKTRLKFNEINNEAGLFFKKAAELIRQLEEDHKIDDNKIKSIGSCGNGISSMRQIMQNLESASNASTIVGEIPDIKSHDYCLIIFDPGDQTIFLKKPNPEDAIDEYFSLETKTSDEHDPLYQTDTVLVKGSSLGMIKKLYPNYFGDISEFVQLINDHIDVFN